MRPVRNRKPPGEWWKGTSYGKIKKRLTPQTENINSTHPKFKRTRRNCTSRSTKQAGKDDLDDLRKPNNKRLSNEGCNTSDLTFQVSEVPEPSSLDSESQSTENVSGLSSERREISVNDIDSTILKTSILKSSHVARHDRTRKVRDVNKSSLSRLQGELVPRIALILSPNSKSTMQNVKRGKKLLK